MNDTPESFREIVEYCKESFGEYAEIGNYEGSSNNKVKIRKIFPELPEKISYFLLRGNEPNEVLEIAFHIDQKDGTEKLETAIKGWENISILGKNTEYDSTVNERYYKARLIIMCDYSEGKEKIYGYIKEFIYQIKNRINDLYGIK